MSVRMAGSGSRSRSFGSRKSAASAGSTPREASRRERMSESPSRWESASARPRPAVSRRSRQGRPRAERVTPRKTRDCCTRLIVPTASPIAGARSTGVELGRARQPRHTACKRPAKRASHPRSRAWTIDRGQAHHPDAEITGRVDDEPVVAWAGRWRRAGALCRRPRLRRGWLPGAGRHPPSAAAPSRAASPDERRRGL